MITLIKNYTLKYFSDSYQLTSTTSCRSSSSIQNKKSIIDNTCLASSTATRKSASSQRAEEDELRGNYSVIPMVLFANITHPDLKTQYPSNTFLIRISTLVKSNIQILKRKYVNIIFAYSMEK